jgi:hypothetical protein
MMSGLLERGSDFTGCSISRIVNVTVYACVRGHLLGRSSQRHLPIESQGHGVKLADLNQAVPCRLPIFIPESSKYSSLGLCREANRGVRTKFMLRPQGYLYAKERLPNQDTWLS